MTFRFFEEEDLAVLYRAFVEAFATYKVPMQMPFEAFRIRILDKLHINPEVSVLAFDDTQCAGFLLHSIGSRDGIKTAYNGGTGVIPAFRGRGLTVKMYAHLMANTSSDFRRVLLEVITSNEPAIKVYQKLGFTYKTTFRCYKRATGKNITVQKIPGLSIKKVRAPKFIDYSKMVDIKPSFIDHNEHVGYNVKNELFLEATFQDHLAGYIIFQPHLGRISQLGVGQKYRRHGIASALLMEAQWLSPKKDLTVINVEDSYQPMHDFLIALGFKHEIDQYEMELLI
jgi:ribosomal protein S18 acetylase RimI-like enzyme